MRGFRGTGLQQEYNVPPGHLPETTSICDQETNNDSTPGHSMPVHNDSQVESDIDTPSLSIRRLLRPVIVTDGHFLNLCVFDTRYLRPRRNKGTDSNTDSAVETEDQNEDEFSDLMNHIDDDLDVESPFLPTIDDDSQDIMEITEEITMEDSGDNNNRNEGCNTATEQPSSHTSGTINWAQRSKDLENVSKVLMDSDVCETFRKGPRIGIDPGIKQQAREKKRQDKIDVLESQLPPFSRTTLRDYFNYLCESTSVPASTPQESFAQHSSSSSTAQGDRTVLTRIVEFYREPWWRQSRWKMKRAQTGAMDTAINRLIGMTGATDGSKKPGNNRAVFGIGLAQFSEASSKHTKLLKRFIKKAS
ncbi:hypothetical protein BGX31_000828 [Mortierella sp. GBA43]|nr:hypothetical protein BGX31_000828 [Mortierella sp. GBA43]